ncbi:hypothetical protein ACM66B_007005 [Microbotryomycetes sp. NB124-2]
MKDDTSCIATKNAIDPLDVSKSTSSPPAPVIVPRKSRHRQFSSPPILLPSPQRPISVSSQSPTSSPGSLSPVALSPRGFSKAMGKRTSVASSIFSFESLPEEQMFEPLSLPPPAHRPSGGKDPCKRGSASPLRQSRANGPSNLPMDEKAIKRNEQRQKAIAELHSTEQTYSACLEEIDALYYQPLLARAVSAPGAKRRSLVQSPPPSTPGSPARKTTPALSRPSSVHSTQSGEDGPVLSVDEIEAIFGTFPQILNLSRTMLATIESGVQASVTGPIENRTRARKQRSRTLSKDVVLHGSVRLGQALVSVLPFLKLYSSFVARFSGAQALLARLNSRSTKWQSFVSAARSQAHGQTGLSSGGIGLDGMLLNIVQRVPRYRLLLEEILKLTDEGHPDHQDLTTCFEIVDQVATHLDQHIRLHAHDLALLELQKIFTNLDTSLLAPGRQLVKTGRFQLLDASTTSTKSGNQTVTVLLFTDMVLLTSCVSNSWWEQSGKLTWNPPDLSRQAATSPGMATVLNRFKLSDVVVVAVDQVKRGKAKFGLEVLRGSDEGFVLFAGSKGERDEWLDRIRGCKSELLRGRALWTDSVSFGNSVRFKVTAAATPATTDVCPTVVPGRREHQDRQRRLSLPDLKQHGRLGFVKNELGTIPATPLVEQESFIEESPQAKLTEVVDVIDKENVPVVLESMPVSVGIAETEYPIVQKSDYRAPVWETDSSASECRNCRAKFSLVWRRKHHCRLCGRVVCANCSTKVSSVAPRTDKTKLTNRLFQVIYCL